MADSPNGERVSPMASLRPGRKSEQLAALLEQPLQDESKVLDALVSGLGTGDATFEMLLKLNQAAEAQERVANLSFAYERLARDARIKLLPKPRQAEFFLAAARFFGDVFGDIDAAIGFAERAHDLAMDDARVFDSLETLLASGQQGPKLAKLYAETAARTKEPSEKLRLLRAALELLENFGGTLDAMAPLYRQIAELDPADKMAIETLDKLYVAGKRYRELSEMLEQSIALGTGGLAATVMPDALADEVRLRLIGIYRGELRDPVRAAPHVEFLLSREPIGQAALQAAEALVDHRPVAPRIAPLLSNAYRRLGRFEDEASTLSLELRLARPPRLAEVQLRLAILRQDVLGDPAGALELLEPLVARDPTDEELRRRYVAVSTTFHREAEAAKLLGRAVASVKDSALRATIKLEISGLYGKQGDAKRARTALESLADDVLDDATRLAVARRLAELYQDGSEPKGLARALEACIRLDPDFPSRVAAAKRLAELCDGPVDDPKLAIVAWRALIGSPRAEEALDRLEALTTKVGDDAGLVEVLLLRAARAKDPNEARKFAFRAAELRAARAPDRAAAIEAWNDLLGTHGESREALTRLSVLVEQHRDFKRLGEVLGRLLDHVADAERPALLGRLARVRLTELHDPTNALIALEAALVADPKEPTARRLAEKMVDGGPHRLDAAAILEPVYRAEQSHVGIVRVLEARAEAATDPAQRHSALLEAFDIAEGSLADPRRALDISARGLELAARSRRADLPAWLERFRRAALRGADPARRAELLLSITADLPIDDAATAELGREAADALASTGDLARALETFRRLLAFEPSSAELLRRVDELLAEQGSPEERLALYRGALATTPDPSRRRELLRTMARLQRRDLSDLASATETLRVLVAENPADIAAHEALVDAYGAAGDSVRLAGELERALEHAVGPRRTAIRVRLAREHVALRDEARALAIYRELFLADELPGDELDRFEMLARGVQEPALLSEVLERRVAVAADERDQAAALERLGDARALGLGDRSAALAAYLRGARLARELPDEAPRAIRLYERVLDLAPDDREAARFLVDGAVSSGAWDRVPAVFAVLLRSEASHEPVDLLLSIEAQAVAASAASEFVDIVDEALGRQTPEVARRARELMAAKARVLGTIVGRRAEVFAIFRGLVESYGDPADIESFRRCLAIDPQEPGAFDEQRWLFSYRAEHAADPVPVLLEWADAEEKLMGDTPLAIRAYERILATNPEHTAARDAWIRLELAEGDHEHLLVALGNLRDRVPSEDAVDVDLRMASLLIEHLGRTAEGLAKLRTIVDRVALGPEALRIAERALHLPDGRIAAAEILGRAALGAEGADGDALLSLLVKETRGEEGLRAERAEWYARLVEIRAAEPGRALDVALEAALEMPGEATLWDTAEKLSRRANDPDRIAEAYRRVLALPLDATLGEAVGRRFVEFQEEWFDEPEAALALLERVLELSPRARWALDRIKLAYNAEGRWDALFALYDRAILLAVDDVEREELLDEAAVAAKDLASDADRAIGYLERRLALRPDSRVEGMLERLYERTGRPKELLQLLEKRGSSLEGPDLARLELRLARLKLDLVDEKGAFELLARILERDHDERAAFPLLERLLQLPRTETAPPKKKSKKKPPASPRHEAVRILESRYRETNDATGLSRVLEAALDLSTTPTERTLRLEELVKLYLDETGNGERAFGHLSTLVQMDPVDTERRERLAAVAERIDAVARRAALLERTAELATERETKIDLYREAASVEESIGHPGQAAAIYVRVLDLCASDRATTLIVGETAEALFASMGRPGERSDVLGRMIAAESDPERRRALRGTLARVASEELGDADRAVQVLRDCLAENASDLLALGALVSVLEGAGRFAELVDVLASRARVLPPPEGRADRISRARLYAERLADDASAIEAWREIRRDFGPDEESFSALFDLLTKTERFVELGEHVAEGAAAAEGEARAALYRTLGDLYRDRTHEPVRAVEAYVLAHDFASTTTVLDRVSDREVALLVLGRLLELSVDAWQSSSLDRAVTVAASDAAHWAIEALVRRHLEERAFARAVEIERYGASLPFSRDRRRKLLRDAAFSTCDELSDPDGAMSILAALFAEDRADEVATASLARFARLLGDAGRHEELARLWEDQARVRADAGDRPAAAVLFARAAEIWETRSENPARAISVHREGAALGGEVSLQALARLYREQKNFRASAAALEWLFAQSSRESLGERALLLGDTYLTLGEWEHARARLEHAAASAIDAEPVRRKLRELYRRYREWEPLCLLLVQDAERATVDRARLALLREAADLHIRERQDPASAIPLFERAIEIDSEDPALRLSLAGALRASGRYEEAGAVLRRQIEKYGARRPKDRAIVHLHLARVSLAAGRRAEALSELELGTKINPAHPGILHELGRLSLAEGQLTRAERNYRALLLVQRKPEEDSQDVPGRAEIYLDLSEIAAALGEPERAAELVESAFETALDNPADAASLERSLLESKRYDLLARAVEGRLVAAADPTSAARALSDLVLLHAAHLAGEGDITPRVQGDALRIHRDLEARKIADDGAWAAMSRVYEWLGDPTSEAKALERRVEALLAAPSITPEDVEPLLRLAEIRLVDPERRPEGVALIERALDAGAPSERGFKLLEAGSVAAPRDDALLRLLERIAREPGRERTLVDVMVLRAEAGPVTIDAVREAVELAERFGDVPAEQALLRGALAHADSYEPRDRGWVEERLGRLVLESGELAFATSLFEDAARHSEPIHGKELLRKAAQLASESLMDLERAARLYRDLLESDPADREVWEPLLEVYRRSGDRDRLIVLIGATAPLVDSLADRGRLRLEEATLMLAEPDRAPAAIELLEGILREDPAADDAADLLHGLLEREGKRPELVRLASSRFERAKSMGDPPSVESLGLVFGSLLEAEGDIAGAREVYGSLLDWNAQSRGALSAIVRLEEERGADPADVADAIERLLVVEEGDAVSELAMRLVELRTEQGDSLGVERALEIACVANPLEVALREQLVARCLERVDWQRAATVLRRASVADPSDHGLLMRAVEAFEHAGDLPHAVETLDLALAESPDNPDLHLERARLLSELGQHDRALQDIEDAHALGGGRASDLSAALAEAIERSEGEVKATHTLRLVNLLEELGETTAAREHLVQLLRHQPKHRDAMRRLASLASAEARWDEAAATYRRLLPLEEGDALVLAAMNLADACQHSGHFADARGGLERALEAMPKNLELRSRLRQLYESTGANRELSHLLLAEARAEEDVAARTSGLIRAAELLLEQGGDPTEAAVVLDEVQRLSPESIQGAVLLARARAAVGRSHEALSALTRVVAAHRGRRTKDLSLVHREISHIHLESGDLSSALDALSKAFELDMRNGELAMQLGHLALDVDDTETASKAFRSVTMMRLKQPGTTEGASAESRAVAYYHLSRIAHAQGDVRKARLMASKAVSENPGHSDAQALLKELRTA
jgi:tetratricopeptide (TPR) repeat protein